MTLQPSQDTRKRIMDAAVKRFSVDGYEAASVDGICAAARVSKGAFYYHFKTKRDLFLGLLQDWLARLESAMEAARKPTVPATLISLTSVLPMTMGSAKGRLNIWLEFLLQASREKDIWKATIAPYHHYRDIFAQMVKQGITEGTLRDVDPQATAQAILSMAVGTFLQSILDPKGADWQRTAEQSMQIMMAGLVEPKPQTARK